MASGLQPRHAPGAAERPGSPLRQAIVAAARSQVAARKAFFESPRAGDARGFARDASDEEVEQPVVGDGVAESWHKRRQVVSATFVSSSEEEDNAEEETTAAAPGRPQAVLTHQGGVSPAAPRGGGIRGGGVDHARSSRLATTRVRALCLEAGRLHELLRREQSRSATAREAAAVAEARALAAERAAGQAQFTVRQLQEELVAARSSAQAQAERTAGTVAALRARLGDLERQLEHQQREDPGPRATADALAASQLECKRLNQEVQALRDMVHFERPRGAGQSGGGISRLASELGATKAALAKAQRATEAAIRERDDAVRQAASGRGGSIGAHRTFDGDDDELATQLQEARAEAAALRRELAIARADAAAAAADADTARAEMMEHQEDLAAALDIVRLHPPSTGRHQGTRGGMTDVAAAAAAAVSPRRTASPTRGRGGGAAHVASELVRLKDHLAALGRDASASPVKQRPHVTFE